VFCSADVTKNRKTAKDVEGVIALAQSFNIQVIAARDCRINACTVNVYWRWAVSGPQGYAIANKPFTERTTHPF